MYYCGIDLASKSSSICISDAKGKILMECDVVTEESGFGRVFARRSRMCCVLEASPLAEWVSRIIESFGHKVIIIDPRRAKAVIRTKKKTDRLDARNLCQMSRTGWYRSVHRKSESARILRTYLQARRGMLETANAMNARIRGLLSAHGIKLGPASDGAFAAVVENTVKSKAPVLSSILRPLLDCFCYASQSSNEMKKSISALRKKDDLRSRLMSVPGVGPLVASAFVSTIDDPRRFPIKYKVGGYVGLAPRDKTS